jgi:hypothetical protein
MAITAAVTVSPSSVQVNRPVTVTVTVSNSGGANVTVTNLVPSAVTTGDTAHQTAGVNWGAAPLGTGLNVTVTAGGTLAIPIGMVPFIGTTGVIGGGSGTLTLGAQVQTSDGSNVAATTTTLTVTSLQSTYAAAQQTSAQPVAYG